MKIVFISRATLYTAPGGDTVQLEATAKYLRNLDVKVDIKLANEKINYQDYDLLHFFNIVRPADMLHHIQLTHKPYVISTIFVDYSEFEKKKRSGKLGFIFQLFSPDFIEYLKVLGRAILNQEKINSWNYLVKGHKHSIKYLIRKASCLLPNSESEYQRLLKRYNTPQKYFVIPNAVDINTFQYKKSENTERKYLLCVARIEELKNQLNLIRAVKNTKYELLIIGKSSPNHTQYYKACQAESGNNITFINHISQEELVKYYTQSVVHILPSWFETTGLSSLEAALMGCNIVITKKGDTVEYFKDFAFYCDPDSVQSIREAIDLAYKTSYNKEFRDSILKNYTWEKTAEATLKAYQNVLQIN